MCDGEDHLKFLVDFVMDDSLLIRDSVTTNVFSSKLVPLLA